MNNRVLWVIIAWAVGGVINPCSAGTKVTVLFDRMNPQVTFAAKELQGALEGRGHTVNQESLAFVGAEAEGVRIIIDTEENTAVMNSMSRQGATISPTLKSEGFSVRTTPGKDKTVWVIGQDAAGAMYGGLELAEVIRGEGLEGIKAVDKNPSLHYPGDPPRHRQPDHPGLCGGPGSR